MADGGSNTSNKKVSQGLIALSSAAVLAVYSAGYLRTKAAADRFELQASDRRPAGPARAALAPAGILGSEAPSTVETAPVTAAPGTPAAQGPSDAAASTRAQIDGTEPAAATRAAAARGEAPVESTTPSTPAAPQPAAAEALASAPPVTTVAPSAPEPASNVAAAPEPATPPAAKGQYTDGTYLGWGSCRHGDIQASVVIEGGRIASASIAQCLTRYSCSWIAPLVPQVAARQSPEVDYVSGATESSYAFYDALVEALSKAK